MPRQANIVQTVGTVAWDGTAAQPMDIRKFVRFGWTAEVLADLAADVTITIEAAPPSDTDSCAPGTFADVPEVVICDTPAVAADETTIIIPAGTVAGTVCAFTIPCRPDAFVRATPSGADAADVRIVNMRQGPMV